MDGGVGDGIPYLADNPTYSSLREQVVLNDELQPEF
jgi:hypothetical protein